MHYLESYDAEVTVIYNDLVTDKDIEQCDKLILSPGPGLPSEAGAMPNIIEKHYQSKPILGVCLGFQAIYEFFGGRLFNQRKVMHGVAVACEVSNSTVLFKNIPSNIKIGLYHSWAADPNAKPEKLEITALTTNGVIMAFQHQTLPIYGVQFHPESILTEFGKEMIQNFLLD